MRIYIGNLSSEVTEDDLQAAFSAFGNVTSCTVIKDRFSGRSRGFAFVDMPDEAAARTAITGVNGTALKGQAVVVNQARERPQGGPSQGRSPTSNRRGPSPRRGSYY